MYSSSEESDTSRSSGEEEAHPLDQVIAQRTSQQEQPPPQPSRKRPRESPTPEPQINIPEGGYSSSSDTSADDDDFEEFLAGNPSTSSTTSSEDSDIDALPPNPGSDPGARIPGGRFTSLQGLEIDDDDDNNSGGGEDRPGEASAPEEGELPSPAAAAVDTKTPGPSTAALTLDDIEAEYLTGGRKTPGNVVLYQEGEGRPERNQEMDRLLRIPRYFDDDYIGGGPRCFKCGGTGHMARDCTAAPRDRSCFLCAGFGHDSRECPNSLCWKCNKAGHMARDCPYGRPIATWTDPSRICMRCGREDCPCAGERDFVRAEGGCTNDYLESDLRRARCLACGKYGHLSCAPGPSTTPKASCYNCGEGGHLAEECWKEKPHAVQAERRGAGAGSGSRSGSKHHHHNESSYGGDRGGGGGYYSGGGKDRGRHHREYDYDEYNIRGGSSSRYHNKTSSRYDERDQGRNRDRGGTREYSNRWEYGDEYDEYEKDWGSHRSKPKYSGKYSDPQDRYHYSTGRYSAGNVEEDYPRNYKSSGKDKR